MPKMIFLVLSCLLTLLPTPGHAQAASPRSATPPLAAPAPQPYVRDPRYWPTPVMDEIPPELPHFARRPAILIFSKTNGYRDDPQIHAADAALAGLGIGMGREVFVTENAAVFNRGQLAAFDIVVLNSTSGNIFTPEQRAAFRAWVEGGGAVVALHGAGGDHHYDWDWYVQILIGAQFIGHTSQPQFQQGLIRIADRRHPAMRDLPLSWQREEEWYAFASVPTGYRTHILARLDESSYAPAPEQRMGDHPIVWTRCIGRGRLFFSALGHKAETWSEPLHLRMIRGALLWAADRDRPCG
jgi:type 1 glutamine amidotransferase